MRDDYKHGDHNVICDRSGRKVKASDTRKEWNGLRVYKDYWEPRHPQDRLKGHPDNQSVNDPRPDSAAGFVALDPNLRVTEEGEDRVDMSGNQRATE